MGRTVYPPPAARKSRQAGVIALSVGATTATATISAVNPAKCRLALLGTSTNGTTVGDGLVRIDLTNATTITANRGSSSNSTSISWELTEVY